MKLLSVLLLFTGLAFAADKRYVVCLVAGSAEQCTKPLTKEAARAVYDVFIAAPISGLDYVYLGDVKTKKTKKQEVQPEPVKPDTPESNDTKL